MTITNDALDLTIQGMSKLVELGPHCTGTCHPLVLALALALAPTLPFGYVQTCSGVYGCEAGGFHPTGMFSCFMRQEGNECNTHTKKN